MSTIEITKDMTLGDVIQALEDVEGNPKFKHHVFKERGTIELVFED